MKYSKKELEEAADLCGAMASWWIRPTWVYPSDERSIWAVTARSLAWQAFDSHDRPLTLASATWSHAEASLRLGWQPGDPVEVLP